MKTVYQLRNDHQYIHNVQQASLYRDDCGLKITHGLFGTDEWWNSIEAGKLALHRLRGVITDVYMSGMKDWPEFQIALPNGEKSSWTRKVDEREFDVYYRIGFQVEIDYVIQSFKRSIGFGLESECVVEIRIGNRID